MQRIQSSAGVLAVFMLTCVIPAQATQWKTAASSTQFDWVVCVDADSVKLDADGFTHYRTKLCSEPENAAEEESVLCDQDFTKKISHRTRKNANEPWEDGVSYVTSMSWKVAKFVCRK